MTTNNVRDRVVRHSVIPDLVVGRDRAHVRNLLVEYPQSEVVSASEFFDKVRMLAFFAHPEIVRDDYAPKIIAERILEQDKTYPLRLSKDFASLYSASFHGTSSPKEVLDRVLGESENISRIFAVLSQIDKAMEDLRLVNGVSALFMACKIIKQQQLIPPNLMDCETISLHHLVDLTMLEIDVIKELSRLGIGFEVRFPLDFQKRGINVAVDFSAGLFEREADLINIDLVFEKIAGAGPLSSLVDSFLDDHEPITLAAEHCTVLLANDLLQEANQISAMVAEKLSTSPHDLVAVVVRTMDARSKLFKQSMKRHGINVRDRKGKPLIATEPGMLLETLFSAKLWGLPRRDLIGLMNHPLFVGHVHDDLARSRMMSLIDELGIDDRIMEHSLPSDRYRPQIVLFQNSSELSEQRMADIAALDQWLYQLDEMLTGLEAKAPLSAYLAVTKRLMDSAMKSDEPAIDGLKNAIGAMLDSKAFSKFDPLLWFNDFVLWLQHELSTLTVPRPDNRDLYAVEFLLLPECLGRRFDHVFIADISFGRMPKNALPDPLLDDRDRAMLNRLMKKPLLRIYLDDPFEPMPTPPRQALEPFWFATAIASAKSSVHFSCARRDESGQEQAPSEFFYWLMENVKPEKLPYPSPKFASLQYERFCLGKHESGNSPYARALATRKSAFQAATTDTFAFSFDAKEVRAAFRGRIDHEPTAALSPTMVEAFYDCRFRGWLERILNVTGKKSDLDDIDARTIGQLAHRSLERFYEHSTNTKDQNARKEIIERVLDETVLEFSKKHYVGNPMVLKCHREWLSDALLSLINHLEEMREQIGALTVGGELDLGLGSFKRPPLAVERDGRRYLLGGRIDRIDQTHNGFLVIDYKLSTSDALRMKLNPKRMLKGNFQAPIYLRLVARHFAHDDRMAVAFAFASIRDGEVLPPVSALGNEEIFDQIFDDASDNSLAQEIDRIFFPIARGEITAKVGEHCSYCDFTYVCRRTEWDHHGR